MYNANAKMSEIYPRKPEILAPVQDLTSLRAAITSGADAVYFGITGFNMRAGAKNFSLADIPEVVRIAHTSNVRAYLALNIIIYDTEIEAMRHIAKAAKRAGINALICWDMAVIEAAKEVGLEIHISTQASVANARAAQVYGKLGAKRIVLARECSLEQIAEIKRRTGMEIEVFIHGAMCVSVSGRCFMSHFHTCKSANRGECLQPCRRNYLIKDVEGDFEYEIGPDYVLSPKDLCTLPFIEKLMSAGIDCFKIEGRNKSPEYVAETTAAYRTVIDHIWNNIDRADTDVFKVELSTLKKVNMERLHRVFNRGSSNGFYLGRPMDAWTHTDGNEATERKVFLGKVTNFYAKVGVIEFKIETPHHIVPGDVLLLQGPTTGTERAPILSMEIEGKTTSWAGQGDILTARIDAKARRNDSVYLIKKAS